MNETTKKSKFMDQLNSLGLYFKKHWFESVIIIISIFLVFFLPKIVYGNTDLQIMNRIFLVLVALQYLFYRLFKNRKNKKKLFSSENTMLVNIAGSVVAILIGFLIGLILMLIVDPSKAFEGLATIVVGGFNGGFKSLGNMIYYAVPVILTGLSVAFAFRTGLFNIGASGQFTMGAFTAVFIGVKWGFLGDVSPWLHWGVAVLFATAVGGIWGAIPGLLKAFRNVNEVVSSIMLNYVAMYMNSLLIRKFIYNQTYARAMDIKTTAYTPDLNMSFLFPNSTINGSIIIAIIVVIIIHIVLNKTTFGYELKAVGFNRHASQYAGINAKRNIVMSMLISGAIAGLAGALVYLADGIDLKPENVILSQGFTGIAISLLGLNTPIGALIAGLFYGSLLQGGYYLQLLNFKPEIIDIIISVIIYVSALSLIIQKFVIYLLKKKEQRQKSKTELKGSDE